MKGVYQITNKTNGKKYIGSSVDIKKRWQDHRGKLRRGCHNNPHLQNAWNKYGKDVFTFEMLEETSNTLEREQWYLDNAIEWGFDYNIGQYVTRAMLGRKHTEEAKRKIGEASASRKRSEEHKRKISEALTGRKHSEERKRNVSEAHKGITHSEEAKRKISETLLINEKNRRERGVPHHSAKLTYEQVWDIHTLYATGNYTQAQLGKRFHVHRAYISDIVRGERRPHVYKKWHASQRSNSMTPHPEDCACVACYFMSLFGYEIKETK